MRDPSGGPAPRDVGRILRPAVEGDEGTAAYRERKAKVVTMAYESFIDKQIREAQERGDFDDLPGYGKPLPKRNLNDPEWWVKQWVEREGLSMVDALPPNLALRRAVELLPETLDGCRSEREARAVIRDLNERITTYRRVPGGGPPVLVHTVDEDEAIRGWRERNPRGR